MVVQLYECFHSVQAAVIYNKMHLSSVQVSLEDFESHVLDHFSCEDRSMDTIHNFDLMLDAPSSFDGDFG